MKILFLESYLADRFIIYPLNSWINRIIGIFIDLMINSLGFGVVLVVFFVVFR